MTSQYSLNALSEAPTHPLWISVLLIFMLVGFAALCKLQPAINVYSNFFADRLQSHSRNEQDSKGLAIFSLCQLGLYIFLALPIINPSFSYSFLLFFVIIIGVISLYFIQILALHFLNYLIEHSKAADSYDHFKSNSVLQLTFPLILINFLLYTSADNIKNMVLTISLVILFAVGMVYFIRLIKIGLKQGLPVWYIILYFCALEIVPIAIVAKSLVNYSAKV